MNDPKTAAEMERCRLVLCVPPVAESAALLEDALSGGDVATVILWPGELDAVAYQAHCEKLVPIAQQHGVAALVCDDTRVMGRCEADGILMTRPGPELKDTVARFSPQKIVGCGGMKDRHGALQVGDANPDFVFFGKPDGDIRPEPHPKNLALAEWWASMIEIPCIVMGGSSLESAVECAMSRAEFVALGLGVFSHIDGPQAAVRRVNELLDEHAPLLVEE